MVFNQHAATQERDDLAGGADAETEPLEPWRTVHRLVLAKKRKPPRAGIAAGEQARGKFFTVGHTEEGKERPACHDKAGVAVSESQDRRYAVVRKGQGAQQRFHVAIGQV